MLSIIIPTFNEEGHIIRVLEHLAEARSGEHALEILVVDGGSTDGTKALVRHFSENASVFPVTWIPSEKGRAKQMNTGFRKASGDILYFLHADSFPPEYFDEMIIQEVAKDNLAGCFKMRFDLDHWWLNLAGWFTKFNWRLCRGGDQSLFISREFFEEAGGFDEHYIVYEDNILIDKLYAQKQFTVIQQEIITSARLYKKYGVWYVQRHFCQIHLKKWLGAPPEELHAFYREKFKPQERQPGFDKMGNKKDGSFAVHIKGVDYTGQPS